MKFAFKAYTYFLIYLVHAEVFEVGVVEVHEGVLKGSDKSVSYSKLHMGNA